MKINTKSQRGAVTLIVLVTMLFLTAFLMTMYIRLANKASISAETTAEIAKRYNNVGDINNIYGTLVADPNLIIPITNREQLEKIGTNENVTVNGKIYKFVPNGNYVIQNDIDLEGNEEDNTTWWTPLPSTFTGVLDGLGYTISRLYIDESDSEEPAEPQGLFGTLNGTVRNLNIANSHIEGQNNVGAIAGINGNTGLIENCFNKSTIIGEENVGAVAGANNGTIEKCKNTGELTGTNVTGGYFAEMYDNTNTPVNVWNKILTKNYKFISGEYIAIVPKEFKVSVYIDEQTIKDGLVIRDRKG